jgi:hypothetical protein
MVARNPEKDIWEEKPKDVQKWNKGPTLQKAVKLTMRRKSSMCSEMHIECVK